LFKKLLINIKEATPNQQKKELWDVEGVLHNQKFKFDLRPLKNNIKGGSFKTKADKMVFDLKDKPSKIVLLDDLISKLDWNIILPK